MGTWPRTGRIWLMRATSRCPTAVKFSSARRATAARPSRARALTLAAFRWLPQLDLVAFRIDDPSEAAVVVVLALGIDGHAFSAQRLEQRIQIVHAIIQHQRR